MRLFINLMGGLIFGLGLVIGGMTNPAKILNFLDITGTWDPSLAFVLGGAVVTTAIGYQLVFMRSKPLIGENFEVPTTSQIDKKLILGSFIFGTGWGLVGYCPGPALASLSLLNPSTFLFVVAMLAGMYGARVLSS